MLKFPTTHEPKNPEKLQNPIPTLTSEVWRWNIFSRRYQVPSPGYTRVRDKVNLGHQKKLNDQLISSLHAVDLEAWNVAFHELDRYVRAGEESKWINDKIRVGEEMVESRWCVENVFPKSKFAPSIMVFAVRGYTLSPAELSKKETRTQ